ncbi:MAG: hypothetical protein PHQ33_02275, partial [Bacteroidales bacterium]|nr:hypothetical protein [Bacteroidales bacterium]
MITGNKANKYIITVVAAFAICSLIWALPPSQHFFYKVTEPVKAESANDTVGELMAAVDSETDEVIFSPKPINPPDSNDLYVPIPNYDNNPLDENQFYSPFNLNNPQNVGTTIVYDSNTNTYNFQNMTGNVPFGPSSSMSVDEYIDYDLRQSVNDYWRERGASYTAHGRRGGGLIPQLHIGGDVFESIFGSNTIDIRPSGNVELIFGVLHNRNDNPSLPVKQRRVTQFNFDENIQMNVLAKIGDKIEFNLNYNTKAMFDFENEMKLKFEGKEDDILQLIEFGNVTLPLNSTL